AAYGKERVVLTRRGKKLVAVVPVEDVQRLEELEDLLDVEDARKALAGAKAKGARPIPWEKAKAHLKAKRRG
ncbi:MAG: type II toxin-antitoxin system prevent-host-death family antitoxin, partial [Planctomycetes bacterium]|nr:type II toxin-antitoxin system prevent-host-death family antitoxin [Planctomycetota bacterium]